MVRAALAFGFFVAVSAVLSMAVVAAPEEAAGDVTKARKSSVSPDHLPRPLETPDTRITSCRVCSGLACTSVQVRGRCTVDKAVEALRRQRDGLSPGVPRHRSRAVTGADYQRLVLEDEAPEPGRATAQPKHRPQKQDTGSHLLEIYENSDRALSVRESDSLSVKAQSFRPLELSGDDDADDSEPAEETDEQKP